MSLTSALHVNFRGNAREALEFYHSVFGGQILVMPYGTDHDAGQSAEQADQVAFGAVVAPSGFRIEGYDVQDGAAWNPGEIPFYASLHGTDADEITAVWKGLSEGARIIEPLAPALFSPLYGKLTDRFGVTWIINVEVPYGG